MIVSLTEEAKRQNIVEEIQQNIFVEAGAGAGKTTLIVTRIVNQIRQGIKPENLVVITFTNAAAGELFDRIERALEKEEKNPENSQKEREHFVYAVENIDRMTISTIHSFCYRLLKERCFDARLPLNVTLLENDRTLDRQKEFFKRWLAKLDKNMIREIQDAIFNCTGNRYYRYWLEKAFLDICEKPKDVNIVCLDDTALAKLQTKLLQSKSLEENLLGQIEQEMDSFADALLRITNREKKTNYTAEGLVAQKCLYADYDRFLLAVQQKNYGKDVFKIAPKLYSGEDVSPYKKSDFKEVVNQGCNVWLSANLSVNPANSTYKQWENAKEESAKNAENYAYFVVMKYACMAREDYQNDLDGKVVSNDELLQRAKDLVWESKEAREYFAEKYHCIYVDEFQDTDRVQAELIWKLVSKEDGGLKEGALFLVGDPKQAIYRFRGGEPNVYYEIKKRMAEEKNACIYELDNNYRSNHEIIDWVNQEFGKVNMSDEILYRPMKCMAPQIADEQTSKTAISGVYGLGVLSGKNKKEKVLVEAVWLAQLINKLTSGNYGIYKKTKGTDGLVRRKLEKITYKDFLVLCWTKWDMKQYLQQMENLGIPVEISGSVEIAENRVLQSFVALYGYLQFPYNKKAKEKATYMVAYEHDIMKNREVAGNRLERLREETKGMNSYAVAQYLLEHMEYLLPPMNEITLTQITSAQAKLRQMVETVFSSTREHPERLVEAFENYLAKVLERELPLSENQNAVQFMNLHKAKGLEGNIVILMNRKGSSEGKTWSPYKEKEKNADGKYDYYSVISSQKSFYGEPILLNGFGVDEKAEEAGQKAIAEDAAESIRLEYVAATRAKEVLVVMEAFDENAPFSRYQIPEENSLEFLFMEEDQVETEAIEESEISEQQVVAYEPVGTEIPKEMYEKAYFSLSPSMLEGLTAEDKEELGLVKNAEDMVSEERRPKGNIFGTTMHRSFELLVKGNKTIENCICQAIMENAEELLAEGRRRYLKDTEADEEYPKAVKAYLEKALTQFVHSEKIQKLFANAKEIYPELPFSYYTSRAEDAELFGEIEKHLEAHHIELYENQPVWINGTADMVLLNQDGSIQIIDYKSDTKHVDSEESFEAILNRKYEGQMILYKHAMSRLFGVDKEKISVELYHLY